MASTLPRVVYVYAAEHLDEWRVLFDSTSPHLEPLPSDWQARLGPFQRLLLLRALRQDKLTQAIGKYVADTMGRCALCIVCAQSARLPAVIMLVPDFSYCRDCHPGLATAGALGRAIP